MSLPQRPTREDVDVFLDNVVRAADETREEFLRRVLGEVAYAKTIVATARRLGVGVRCVRDLFRKERRTTFAAICRVAEAVDCEVVIRSRTPSDHRVLADDLMAS